MRLFKSGTAAAGIALIAALAAAGCSSPSPPPTLIPGLSTSPPDPARWISGGSIPMRANDFSIELDTFLCSTRDVRITSLRLYRPSSGIRLARWGINNRHVTYEGAAAGPLSRLGPYTSHSVTPRCHHATAYAAVGLELQRIKPGTQSFLGLRVTYNSDGQQTVAYLSEQLRVHDPHKRSA